MKAVSFDLDGTLADTNFDDALWFKAIPEAYARKQGMPFAEALDHCKRAYDLEGDASIRWYDPNYWFEFFGIESEKARIVDGISHLVKLYPDTIPALESLKKAGCRLFVVSGAMHEFIEFKTRVDGLGKYFEGFYSAVSDFESTKKNSTVFERAAASIGVKPSELWHVGNNYLFDYEVPRDAGVNAFYLDRSGRDGGPHTVRDLREFAEIVLRG